MTLMALFGFLLGVGLYPGIKGSKLKMNQQELSDIIADSETIVESIPNYVLLKYVLYEALKRVIEELPRRSQVNPTMRSILILSKVRTLLNFLKYLLPIYSNHARDIISRGKQFILSRWASSHDYYRVLRSVDEFPVTFTEVHGFYDPIYAVNRAIVMLSGPVGAKLTRWPFHATPISMLQASREQYKLVVRAKYKQVTTEEVVRYMMRELKPSSMTVAVSGIKVAVKTKFYRCVFIADVNFYRTSGVDFLPLEPLKLQFYLLELANNATLTSTIMECIREKFQRVRKSLEITSVRSADTRLYMVHYIICDFVSSKATSIMIAQTAVYKASNQNQTFQLKTSFYKRNPNVHSIQIQDALHDLAIPAFHQSFEKSKNRLLQPCFAVIFRLTRWNQSMIERIYELGGCMLEELSIFYPYIDPKTLISYSVDEDNPVNSIKSLALGVGRGSNQTIDHIISLYKQGRRKDNYTIFLFRPIYSYPFGLIQLLSDNRTKHRRRPDFIEQIPAEKVPYYAINDVATPMRSQAGAHLFRTIMSLYSRLMSYSKTLLSDLYQYLKSVLASTDYIVDATRENLQAEISSVELILNESLGLVVSISDDDAEGLRLSLLINNVDVTEIARKIFSAAIYKFDDSLMDYMTSFVDYFFLLLDLASGAESPYFSKLTWPELRTRLSNNRYVELESINLTTIFTGQLTEEDRGLYLSKVLKALQKFNYILRTCRFSMEIPGTKYSLWADEVKSFKPTGDDYTNNFNSSLTMSLANISEQLNYYHGGYFIPTPTPYTYFAVAMWDKKVRFYSDFLKESESLKASNTDMTIQRAAECCVFVALAYLLPSIIRPPGLVSTTTEHAWTGSIVKLIPISSAYLKYLKCNEAYESDFLATYAFLNTTVTTCRVSGSSMCLSRLYGIASHIDSLLWHRALERLLLVYNPLVVIENNKTCVECKHFHQFVQKTIACSEEKQELSFIIQLYSILIHRSTSQAPIPYKLQVTYRKIPTVASESTKIETNALFSRLKQCKDCNCSFKNSQCIQTTTEIELHLLIYKCLPNELMSREENKLERSICVYIGPASYSFISNALLTIAPTICCLNLAKNMIENLPLHLYLQPSETAVRDHHLSQQQRALQVDFRTLTRRDLVTLLWNLRSLHSQLILAKLDITSVVKFILDPDIIPTSIDWNAFTPEQHNIFLKLMVLHQDFISKRSLRRCVYSFKLPGQKVPLMALLPSRGIPSLCNFPVGSESLLGSGTGRQKDVTPLHYTLTNQLRLQASFWSDDKAENTAALHKALHASGRLLCEYNYNIIEEAESIVIFGVTNLAHLITQHAYRLDLSFDKAQDQRAVGQLIRSHKLEFPGGYLNAEQLALPPTISASSNTFMTLESYGSAKQFLDMLLGKVYENARLLGTLIRVAYLPSVYFEDKRFADVIEFHETTDVGCIRITAFDREFTAVTTIEPASSMYTRAGIQKELLEKIVFHDCGTKYQPEQSATLGIGLTDSHTLITVSDALHYKRFITTLLYPAIDLLSDYIGLLHLSVRMACIVNPSIISNKTQSYYIPFDLNPPSIYVQLVSGSSSGADIFKDAISFPATMHMWLQNIGSESTNLFAPGYLRYNLVFDAPPFKYVQKGHDNSCVSYIMRYYNNEVLPIIFLGSLSKRFDECFAPHYNLNVIGTTSIEMQRRISYHILSMRNIQLQLQSLDVSAVKELLDLIHIFNTEKSRLMVAANNEHIPFTLVQSNGRIKPIFGAMYERLRNLLIKQCSNSSRSFVQIIKTYYLLLNVICGKMNNSFKMGTTESVNKIIEFLMRSIQIRTLPRYWLSELGYEAWDRQLAKYFAERYVGINFHHLSVHSILIISTINAVIYRRALLQFLQQTFDTFMGRIMNRPVAALHRAPYFINPENISLLTATSVVVCGATFPDGQNISGSGAHMYNTDRLREPLFSIKLTYTALQRESMGLDFLSHCMLIAKKSGSGPGGSNVNQIETVQKLPLPLYIIKEYREQGGDKRVAQNQKAIRYDNYIIIFSLSGRLSGWSVQS